MVLTLIPVHLNLKHTKISWCMNGSTSSAQQRHIDTLSCFTLEENGKFVINMVSHRPEPTRQLYTSVFNPIPTIQQIVIQFYLLSPIGMAHFSVTYGGPRTMVKSKVSDLGPSTILVSSISIKFPCNPVTAGSSGATFPSDTLWGCYVALDVSGELGPSLADRTLGSMPCILL